MTDYITPEFISLAEKIQNEIEPEVGMLFVSKGDWTDVIIRIYNKRKTFDLGIAGEGFGKRHGILLPSLSWLVRKLAEHEHKVCDLKYNYPDGTWTAIYGHGFTHGETSLIPELAALKALCRIKGLEV